MKTVNNKERALFNRGQHKKKKQEKDNKSKNAILLLLLIDGILIAYFYTLLDSDEIIPASDDQLYGEDGNDDIEGKGGNDIIDGGPGDDTIRGGKGRDYITGGKGNDIIAGGGNGDVFHVYLGSHANGETNRHIVTDFHWETDSGTGKPTSDSDTVNIGETKDDAVTALTTLRFSNAHYFELDDLAPDGVIPEKMSMMMARSRISSSLIPWARPVKPMISS